MTNLKDVTDSFLLQKTRSLVRDESKTTTEILHHLREIESRKLFAGLGYSSLFDYAVRELGYAEASAQRRIASMILLKELPQVEEKIQSGELSLSVVAQAQSFFRQEEKVGHKLSLAEKEEVMACLGKKSSREAERTLLNMSSAPEKQRADHVKPLTDKASLVSFVVSEETLQDLERLKGLLSHKHPNLGFGDLVAILAKRALNELDPAKKAKALPTSEVVSKSKAQRKPVPVAIQRLVWKRDSSQCTFNHEGGRCQSRYQLEIDHIDGLDAGNEIENLRLLCRQHNQWAAAQRLGRDKMQAFWN